MRTVRPMWAAFVGFFAGRAIGNGQVPDSVKQQRWDARQARRSRRALTPGQWLLLVVVGLLVVGLVMRYPLVAGGIVFLLALLIVWRVMRARAHQRSLLAPPPDLQ